MALNTFTSGVNTSFSTELNENFIAITQNFDQTGWTVTSSTVWEDTIQITTPATTKDSQTVLVEAYALWETDSTEAFTARLYDVSASTTLSSDSIEVNVQKDVTHFLVATPTITSSGGTKDIKWQMKKNTGASSVNARQVFLKATLIP